MQNQSPNGWYGGPHGWYGGPHGGYGPMPGAYPPLAQALLWGLSNLFWIGLLATVIWSAVQAARMPDRRALAKAGREPSALELLRASYVLGQIDIYTFEEMLTPLLESEKFEQYSRLSPPTLL